MLKWYVFILIPLNFVTYYDRLSVQQYVKYTKWNSYAEHVSAVYN